jgi:hypothetical protein
MGFTIKGIDEMETIVKYSGFLTDKLPITTGSTDSDAVNRPLGFHVTFG